MVDMYEPPLLENTIMEWIAVGHSKIPISPSLHKAINQKSSFLRHIRQTWIDESSSSYSLLPFSDYLIDSVRRLVKGDLFAFPNDIYPVKPDISTIGNLCLFFSIHTNGTVSDGQLLMRFRTSNISRMGFPDTKGVRRDFKVNFLQGEVQYLVQMCKYSSLTESTADIIQIFMSEPSLSSPYSLSFLRYFCWTNGLRWRTQFLPYLFEGITQNGRSYTRKMVRKNMKVFRRREDHFRMSWNYVDPDRFQRIYDPSILNIQANDDPFMKENGYILAERGTGN